MRLSAILSMAGGDICHAIRIGPTQSRYSIRLRFLQKTIQSRMNVPSLFSVSTGVERT